MIFLIFRPDGQDFCDPQLSQTYVFDPFPPGAGGDIFFYPNMEPGPRPVALALGQAQPGLILFPTWTRLGIGFGAHLGPIWGPFGSYLGSILPIFGSFWLMGLAHCLFWPILL